MKQVALRLDDDDYQTFKAAADAAKISFTDWIRAAAHAFLSPPPNQIPQPEPQPTPLSPINTGPSISPQQQNPPQPTTTPAIRNSPRNQALAKPLNRSKCPDCGMYGDFCFCNHRPKPKPVAQTTT